MNRLTLKFNSPSYRKLVMLSKGKQHVAITVTFQSSTIRRRTPPRCADLDKGGRGAMLCQPMLLRDSQQRKKISLSSESSVSEPSGHLNVFGEDIRAQMLGYFFSFFICALFPVSDKN
ncbi:hypothetical protein NPIL_488301 [Nephila pilipes]|uniref:Uncharacterized protein n=1 Tax=Nephila pilipes TaxID=299642 RepID=A0A8X6TSV8_NEPPI|nr:hypothetical protein NPIL_488301 [Nephila pilipes]